MSVGFRSLASTDIGKGPRTIDRYAGLLRVCLVPVFVVLCYQFDWELLRSFTCYCFVTVAHWLAIPAVRTSPVYFSCQGRAYFFALSCTALDAFCGSIPLLWRPTGWAKQALFWGVYLAVLSFLNLVRLVLGFVLFLEGVPWWLAHEAMSGVFYFGLLVWIIRQGGWRLDTIGLRTSPRVLQKSAA